MLCFIMYKAVINDIKTMEIPDECSIAIVMLAVGMGGFTLPQLNLALFIIILSGSVLGMGDAKLLGSLSLIFGAQTFLIIAAAFILCSFSCIAGLINKEISMKSAVPFSPYIAAASIGLFLTKRL